MHCVKENIPARAYCDTFRLAHGRFSPHDGTSRGRCISLTNLLTGENVANREIYWGEERGRTMHHHGWQ
jgi:hypothetical protein